MFGSKEQYDERFATIYKYDGKGPGTTYVLVDKATGVEYLYIRGGDGSSGLTMLAGPDGRPLVNEAFRRG